MKLQKTKTPKENTFMDELIISIFYDIDNFFKELKNYFEHSFIPYSGTRSGVNHQAKKEYEKPRDAVFFRQTSFTEKSCNRVC